MRYILAGDSKGAVRAMREAGDAGEKTGRKLQHTGDEAEASFAHIEKGAHRMRGAVGLLAGAAGLGGLAFGIKDAVQAGVQLQQQQSQLRVALKNTGQASAENVKRINEAVEASATHGGFKGQDELGAVSQFVRLTGSATKAITLNKEAVELARGAHIGYDQAVKSVAQAQTGNTGKLQKLIGVILPVKTHIQALTAAQKKQSPELVRQATLLDKQATAMQANKQILDKFGGAQEAYGKTTAGAISNAQHAIEQLAEKVGTVLLPYVAKAAQQLTKLIDVGIKKWPVAKAKINEVIDRVKVIVAWFKKNMDVTEALAAGVGVIVTAWTAYTVATKIATVATAAFNAVMALNPIELVVLALAALTAGVVYCYLHFKTFRTVVDGVFSWVKGAAVATVSYVKKHWKTLALVLSGPFAPLVFLLEHIRTVIRDIIKAGGAVKHAYGKVSGVAGKVGHFLGFNQGGVVPGYASGGVIGGSGNSDTVPAMLTPGEGILRRSAVAAVGGPAGVAALNNGSASLGGDELKVHTHVYLSEREVAEAVTHYQLRMAARR